MSGTSKSIRLDLNSPELQEVFFKLQADELKQVVASLGRLHGLDRNALYRHIGLRWEAIEHLKAPMEQRYIPFA